jgi:YgiT-type zinc finger domain-containing protein
MMSDMEFPAPEKRKKYLSKCSVCGGTVTEGRVDVPVPDRDGRIRLIEGVPAGVCDQCHEYYLTVETSRVIDRLLAAPPSREDTILVWEFAKAG